MRTCEGRGARRQCRRWVLPWCGLCVRTSSSTIYTGVLLYRVSSLMRDSARLGPYSRTMPRALWQS